MIKKWIAVVIGLCCFLAAAGTARAGGWAVITLKQWPADLRQGNPVRIVFSIRQHGQVLAPGYDPLVHLQHEATGRRVAVAAAPGARPGDYTATFVLPEAGVWNWWIGYSQIDDYGQSMPPLSVAAAGLEVAGRKNPARFAAGLLGALVVTAGAAGYAATQSRRAAYAVAGGLAVLAFALLTAPAAPATAATPPTISGLDAQQQLGWNLFQAKGCVVCHNHAQGRLGFDGLPTNVGPDLTGMQLPAEYIQVWLANPAAVKPETFMPNLELTAAEIEALTAFLTMQQ